MRTGRGRACRLGTLLVAAAAGLVACAGAPAPGAGGSSAQAEVLPWEQVAQQARGQTVDLWMYGGDQQGNAYVDDVLAPAAQELGVTRYVMVSAMGTRDVQGAGEAMGPYLQAKKDADDALMASGLDWTIVRPGRLTDAPGTGSVDAPPVLGRDGEITRDDTALVLLETLERLTQAVERLQPAALAEADEEEPIRE